ncbi:MAG: hypothetical protein KGM98_02970, partial [Bacteroidota bacterium]|nr:hypothetical protein [Bacteroidota bacterium]
MSSCSFTFPISGDPEIILSKARTAVESQQGTFTGDLQSGNFEVSVFSNLIKGNYEMSQGALKLNITHKPLLIPCSTIEMLLKSQIS